MPQKCIHEFKTVSAVNSTGGAIVRDQIVNLGGLGWGLAKTAAASLALLTFVTGGIISITKVNTDTFALGDTVYWDAGQSRASKVQPTGGGKALGVCKRAAVNGELVVELELNAPPDEYQYNGVGNASGGGLALAHGFGITPTGPLFVQVLTNAGVPRTINSIVRNATNITIVTSAGAADDIVWVRAWR